MSKSVEFKMNLSNGDNTVEGACLSSSPATNQPRPCQVRLPPVDRGYAWVIVVGILFSFIFDMFVRTFFYILSNLNVKIFVGRLGAQNREFVAFFH